MTISEIRKLLKEYHSLEDDNYDLFSEMQRKTIFEKLNASSELFSTTASELEHSLKEIFVQNKKAPFNAISLRAQIKNINNENSTFCYHLKLIMSTNLKHTHLNQTLANLLVLSKDEITDSQFMKNCYEINLIPILLNTHSQNSDLIYKACFNIVERNLFKNYNNQI